QRRSSTGNLRSFLDSSKGAHWLEGLEAEDHTVTGGDGVAAMQTIMHNTAIVTADDACTVHYDAAIAIDGARIAAIGPNAELLARYPTAERIDGRGKAVMPGFAKRAATFSRRAWWRPTAGV